MTTTSATERPIRNAGLTASTADRTGGIPSRSVSRRAFVAGSAALAGAALLPGGREWRSAAAQGGPVELRWSMWSATQAETDVWQGLADDVTAAHPNITVKLETTSFPDYWDKLQTQLASQTEADIIAMQSLRMPGFAARNALRPLQPLIDQDPSVDYPDFFESIQEGLSYDGQVYAFAYDLGPIMLFYNKDLLSAAGIPFPSAETPITWEQFRDAAVKLTDANAGQYGFVFQPGFDGAVPWIWSGGGDYMNAEETECTLNSPESLAALNFLVGLFTEDQVAPPITDLANPLYAAEAFQSGKIGMYTNGPWEFVNLRENAAFGWDIAPIPAGPAGSVTWVAGSGFGISNTTEHPEEAWQALKVITSPASLQKLAAAGRGYPARRSAVPAFIEPNVPPAGVAAVERIVGEQGVEARFYRTTTTWQETQVMLTRDFNPVFLGQQTVEETVDKVKPQWDELLEKHQRLLGR